MKDEWRLNNQIKYLYKKEVKKVYFRKKGMNDHEHCEFCWDKFSERPGDLHEGYMTMYRGQERWICETCYQDFKEMFEWKLVKKDNE